MVSPKALRIEHASQMQPGRLEQADDFIQQSALLFGRVLKRSQPAQGLPARSDEAIAWNRGRVKRMSREALESRSCECCWIVKECYDSYLIEQEG